MRFSIITVVQLVALACLPHLAEASKVSSSTDVFSGISSLTDVLKTPIGVPLSDFNKIRPGAGSFSFDKPGPVDLVTPDQVLLERIPNSAFDTVIFNFLGGKLSRIAAHGYLPKKTVESAKRSILEACDSMWGSTRSLVVYEIERKGETSHHAAYRWNFDGKRGELMFEALPASGNSVFVGVSVIDLGSYKKELAQMREKRLKGKAKRKVFRDVGFENSR